MDLIRRSCAAILAASIVLLSPGLPCYEAAAAEFNTTGSGPIIDAVGAAATNHPGVVVPGALNTIHKIDVNAGIPSIETSAPTPELIEESLSQTPATPQIQPLAQTTVIPEAQTLTAPETTPEKPSALGEGQQLGHQLTIAGQKGAGSGERSEAALRTAIDGQKATATQDSTPVATETNTETCSSGGCPFTRLMSWRPGKPSPYAKAPPTTRQLYAAADTAGRKLYKSNLLNAVVGAVVAATAFHLGVIPAASALIFALFPAIMFVGGAVLLRQNAMAKLNQGTIHAEDANRRDQFQTLFRGETLAQRAARLSRWGAFATMDSAGMLVHKLWALHPAVAVLFAVAALIGFYALRRTKGYDKAVHLLRVGLYGRLSEGKPQRALESIPGTTSLEKHVGFFAGGETVVHFGTTYNNLRASGEAIHTALFTTIAAHVIMSIKTQRGLTREQKAQYKLGFFDIYRPNIGAALAPSDSGAFATADKPDGTKRGDVDMEKFNHIFPAGQDYVTGKDIARLVQANFERDAGKASLIKRLLGRMQSKRSFDQMLALMADRVVIEDGKPVPAISRDQLLWLYQGRAMYDLIQERTGRDILKK